MEIEFFNLNVGKNFKWGFSLFKVSASDGTGEIYRSFIETVYNFKTQKWSIMLLWYQVL